LKHPNWQRKRLEVLESAGFQCELCEEKEKTLHVHHKRYVKGREIWEYTRQELACLCEDCHAEHHELHGLLEEVLASADHFNPYRAALGLVSGYMLACYSLDGELEQRVRAKVGAQMDLGIIALQFATMAAVDLHAALVHHESTSGSNPVLSSLIDRVASRVTKPEDNAE
jgi:hypothetical protein